MKKTKTTKINSVAHYATDSDLLAAIVMPAYNALKAETGLRNIPVYAIAERTGMPAAMLIPWLESECEAHRANPTLGEPTALTPEQRVYGMTFGGTETHPAYYNVAFEG